MTHGSDPLVAALENEGVDRIFGIPGEENLDVVESLLTSKTLGSVEQGSTWSCTVTRPRSVPGIASRFSLTRYCVSAALEAVCSYRVRPADAEPRFVQMPHRCPGDRVSPPATLIGSR